MKSSKNSEITGASKANQLTIKDMVSAMIGKPYSESTGKQRNDIRRLIDSYGDIRFKQGIVAMMNTVRKYRK